MRRLPLLLVSLLLGACMRNADDPRPPDRPSAAERPDTAASAAEPSRPATNTTTPDTLSGTVVVTSLGPSSRATLSSTVGPPILLAGPLEPELRQLAGAQVTLIGDLSGEQTRLLEVQHYDVISIDGERPVIGIVLAGGSRIAAGADTLAVIGRAEPLPERAKVWIIGRRDGAELRLQSWGVIRRP